MRFKVVCKRFSSNVKHCSSYGNSVFDSACSREAFIGTWSPIEYEAGNFVFYLDHDDLEQDFLNVLHGEEGELKQAAQDAIEAARANDEDCFETAGSVQTTQIFCTLKEFLSSPETVAFDTLLGWPVELAPLPKMKLKLDRSWLKSNTDTDRHAVIADFAQTKDDALVTLLSVGRFGAVVRRRIKCGTCC